MIGDVSETLKKAELQQVLDKLRRNVEGVGSMEELKKQYPTGYAKIRASINEIGNAYTACALKNVEAHIPDEEVQKTWGNKSKEIANAINNFSSDEVQNILSNFIGELMLKYKEKIIISHELEGIA